MKTLVGVVVIVALQSISGCWCSSRMERKLPGNLISFKPIGKEVILDVRIQAPFLSIATKRKPFETDQALVNFNPAALITSALVIGSSLFLGLGLRTLQNLPRKQSRKNLDISGDFFDKFSWTLKNSSGIISDTNLTDLWPIMEERIYHDRVNLPDCFKKTICSSMSKPSNNTAFDQILDGLLDIDWLQPKLQNMAFMRDMMERQKLNIDQDYCDHHFSSCQLKNPLSHFWHIFNNFVNSK